MPTCVVFNPAARGDKARRFRAALSTLDPPAVFKPTPAAGTAGRLAAEAVAEGFDTVVAAGGDGTVSEVVDGLVRVPGGLEGVRLGVIPLGTINVFARELGLPLSLAEAWRVIGAGQETRVDLPVVESGPAAGRETRAFVQLAGAGLDSRAIALVDWEWKKRVGPFAYLWAGLRALRGPHPQVRVKAPGRETSGTLVLVGNGRYYGGELPMFPGADLRDGLLDVRVFRRVGWATLAGFLWSLIRRRPWVAGGEESGFQAERVELSAEVDLPFEVDGDNVGSLPAVFTLRREALRVLVPPSGAAGP